jgi:spoIIIJ-associated protein
MEWVETTGRTVADAKDAALDQLGVDEAEAEFEVIEEAKNGLFGRVRREARVRARVQPRAPRPKAERRRSSRGDRKNRSGSSRDRPGKGRGDKPRRGQPSGGRDSATRQQPVAADDRAEQDGNERPPRQAAKGPSKAKRSGRSSSRDGGAGSKSADQPKQQTKVSDPVNVQEQGQMVRSFLEGLADAFDLDGEVTVTEVDDDTIEVTLDGDDLGLMIGPKGQTLQAIHELSRASMQRAAAGPLEGRVRIDIGAYRAKRREALGRFATQQANEVLDAGVERALEPMNAADRKVVHDTVNEIAGVRTVSEGEDARRRVVIIPD